MIKMFCRQPVNPGDIVILRNDGFSCEAAMNVVASTSLAVVLKPTESTIAPFSAYRNTVYRLMGRYHNTRPKDASNYPHYREIRWMVAW